jgi:hypothetical protein
VQLTALNLICPSQPHHLQTHSRQLHSRQLRSQFWSPAAQLHHLLLPWTMLHMPLLLQKAGSLRHLLLLLLRHKLSRQAVRSKCWRCQQC